MARSRLTLALEAGSAVIPAAGEIAVFQATVEHDLSALPKDRVTVVQGNYTDHQAFVARGYQTKIDASGKFSAAIVFLPRSKQQARNLIHFALSVTNGGPVIIDGQKTDGIDSILKNCRIQGGNVSGVFAKSHGKVFTLSGGDFSSWARPKTTSIADGFVTSPGVFSADGIDRGSDLLAASLPNNLSGKVADLGAGWGFLSHHILRHDAVTQCHLIETNHDALECAKVNICDPRAQFHWADALNFNAESHFDTVVTNPPFHTGRVADPSLGRAFIDATSRLLRPRGVVWLVANRHLPYEQHLSALFKEVSEVNGDTSFKIFRAANPRPTTAKSGKGR